MGFNDAMSGYKKLKNEKGYTNQDLFTLLKGIEYSFGTPEMGTIMKKKEAVVFYGIDQFTVYVMASPKAIEIGRCVEKGTGKFVLKELGAAILTDAVGKNQADADRAVDELYDVLIGLEQNGTVENKSSSDEGVKLYMRQKVVSIKDKYSICDIDENPKYWVVGNLLGLNFKIEDNAGNPIMEVGKKIVSVMPSYTLTKDGNKIGAIKKKIKLTRPEISGEVNGQKLEIKGDLTGYHFAIKLNDAVVGNVDTERLTWGDVYSIDIRDTAHQDLIVAIAIICDNSLKNK